MGQLDHIARAYRRVEPRVGNVHAGFDLLDATERSCAREIAHNGSIRSGIGAEGPAEIEDFRDPFEISLSTPKRKEQSRPPPRRKSLKQARGLLTEEEREEEDVRVFMKGLFAGT